MRQPDGYNATNLIQDDSTNRKKDDGLWVPARAHPHNAFGFTWRFQMAWAVFTGEADALFWDEES